MSVRPFTAEESKKANEFAEKRLEHKTTQDTNDLLCEQLRVVGEQRTALLAFLHPFKDHSNHQAEVAQKLEELGQANDEALRLMREISANDKVLKHLMSEMEAILELLLKV